MHLLTGARGGQALSRPSSSAPTAHHRARPSPLPRRYYESSWSSICARSVPSTATTTTTTTTTTAKEEEELGAAAPSPSPPPSPSPAPWGVEEQERRTPSSRPLRATQQTLDDVKSLLQSLPIEFDYELSFSAGAASDSNADANAAAPPATLEGQLPPDLVGTFLRNGPGLLVDTPEKHGHRHAFDGDGVVVRFSFSGAGRGGGDGNPGGSGNDGPPSSCSSSSTSSSTAPRVRLHNRFIRTLAFDEEQKARKPLYRSSFTRGGVGGSAFFNPFDFTVKNTANTSLLWWGGKLAALFEAGLAHLIDPKTLETTARDSRIFGGGGASSGGSGGNSTHPSPAIDSATIGAHYRVCSFTGNLVMFSVGPGFPDAQVAFFELGPNGERVSKTTAALPGTFVPLVHDFALTENYYVLVEGPVKLDLKRFFLEYPLGKAAIAETLVFDEQAKARVHLIPRPKGRFAGGGRPARVFDAPSSFFAFHLANAYEVERSEAREAAREFAGRTAGEKDNGKDDGDENGNDAEPLVVVDAVAWDSVDFSSFNYSVLEGDPQPITPDYYEGGARTTLVRLVVDPLRPTGGATTDADAGGGEQKVSAHRLLRRTAEFPQIDPQRVGRPHSAIFLGADALDDDVSWRPLHAVVRLDVDPLEAVAQSYAVARGWAPLPQGAASPLKWRLDEGRAAQEEEDGGGGGGGRRRLQAWDAGARTLIMEQLFVPRSSLAVGAGDGDRGESREGEGYLVGTGYDAEKKKGVLLIFDAERVDQGPLAKITLGHHLPSGLHSVFVPGETFGAFDRGVGVAEEPRRVVTY